MQRKNSNRMDRVNEELKKELSIIIDHNLKNPNITGIISVTKVKTSPDLKFAKVYISLLNCESKKNTLEGLKNATGFIRTEIAKRVNLRYTPEIIFEIDDSMEYGARIENILKNIIPKEEK
ncbi:MAG: 30S ribosome-binding factor RbfA [Clostridia bacterium]|nr:30S ribosome-binding factor RbfA [Clostridia bacterium]